MAYQIQGSIIISDTRDLIGINTAGIDSVLFVGEQIQLDAASGIITAVEYRGDGSNLTGILTEGGSGGSVDNINISGIATIGNLNVTGVSTFSGDLNLNNNDILNGGDASFESLDVTGHIEGDTLQISGLSTFAGAAEFSQISFTGGEADEFATGITTDLNESSGANELITAEGTKNYVDSQVGAANQLNFGGDEGLQGEIDLASEALDIAGEANEIVTGVAVGLGNTLTVGLSTELQLPGSLAFGVGQAVNVVGVETSLVDTTAGVATDTSIPTQLAVKTYVDEQVSGGTGAVNLVINDGTNTGTINIGGGEELQFNGTANEIEVLVSGTPGEVTIGLPDAVAVTDLLTVGNGSVITGVCTATDFNSTSDIRKKDNIVEIDDAVAKVQALRGVTFDWKDGSGSSGGIIAQEVEAVLPSLVKEGADHKTVIYNGLIGLLVQAVKEQADQIAALQEKLG